MCAYTALQKSLHQTTTRGCCWLESLADLEGYVNGNILRISFIKIKTSQSNNNLILMLLFFLHVSLEKNIQPKTIYNKL